ncbi:MAG: hypothetical protein FWD12_15610, partial [Alphaproteobacteria bacterium]|nr:hypothetical protein [Alphaproteobacteria bacterium]
QPAVAADRLDRGRDSLGVLRDRQSTDLDLVIAEPGPAAVSDLLRDRRGGRAVGGPVVAARGVGLKRPLGAAAE